MQWNARYSSLMWPDKRSRAIKQNFIEKIYIESWTKPHTCTHIIYFSTFIVVILTLNQSIWDTSWMPFWMRATKAVLKMERQSGGKVWLQATKVNIKFKYFYFTSSQRSCSVCVECYESMLVGFEQNVRQHLSLCHSIKFNILSND